jgi:hypothetical protein
MESVVPQDQAQVKAADVVVVEAEVGGYRKRTLDQIFNEDYTEEDDSDYEPSTSDDESSINADTDDDLMDDDPLLNGGDA